jgi:hypothetical protein
MTKWLEGLELSTTNPLPDDCVADSIRGSRFAWAAAVKSRTFAAAEVKVG